MTLQRVLAAAVVSAWLAVISGSPFAAVHELIHHTGSHHTGADHGAREAGLDSGHGHGHGNDHDHQALGLSAGTGPRSSSSRDVGVATAPLPSATVEFQTLGLLRSQRFGESPPPFRESLRTTILRN